MSWLNSVDWHLVTALSLIFAGSGCLIAFGRILMAQSRDIEQSIDKLTEELRLLRKPEGERCSGES